MRYAFPPGGHPGPNDDPEGTAIFTTAYAVLPSNTMRDIVTSFLPGWTNARAWILARPLSGFAETFAQYAVELAPGGGSAEPEPDPDAQAGLFITHGTARLTLGRDQYELRAGHYVYIPPSAVWTLWNSGEDICGFLWIRKRYEKLPGQSPPDAKVVHETDVTAHPMPGCDGTWATQRFADPFDLRYDFHVNIVNFLPGGRIPFAETHIMEHGLFVLQGTARYLLNTDWVEVGPGDFMWLRAFCPQACIATGTEPFRYLLYKDVNRHPKLSL
ncbi:putative allantoin catabolism protein [Thalassovita gelatinovora]|uniref:Putative allantoin catabolism protein n=1 Tax=Thalassovita gelatinovora TaxID=53501 RepID=A0A0P1F5Y4_THAGE|nr:bifunctional allantoicase/(S)-ureidoglycine aminohydrolase [Thalassovita gelatinovora]QIZ80845.1 (S)-ureidoglycine aminohydrolase [Thalassovita gelatinovora]CUH63279.1 putative allantoin catabolism protein [Thalassovita gelatinovora]SEQ64511.1 (S)-ureidoglycine aminohydrolase [Thalassovita gelatinovora]